MKYRMSKFICATERIRKISFLHSFFYYHYYCFYSNESVFLLMYFLSDSILLSSVGHALVI